MPYEPLGDDEAVKKTKIPPTFSVHRYASAIGNPIGGMNDSGPMAADTSEHTQRTQKVVRMGRSFSVRMSSQGEWLVFSLASDLSDGLVCCIVSSSSRLLVCVVCLLRLVSGGPGSSASRLFVCLVCLIRLYLEVLRLCSDAFFDPRPNSPGILSFDSTSCSEPPPPPPASAPFLTFISSSSSLRACK